MRIVFDLQGAQATNRNRGIGRYCVALAKAVARNRGQHEVFVALSGLFPDSIESIRAAFYGLIPQENICVWQVQSKLAFADAEALPWRRKSAELVREAYLASLCPDIIHIGSLFEGLWDDSVTSVGSLPTNIPISVTLFDLIPLIHRSPYLDNPTVEGWYQEKITYLCKASLWLAISESSRNEGIDQLGLPREKIVNVSADADEQFSQVSISREEESIIRERYGLSRSFIMYTGGVDHRKNIEGLVRAFCKLPLELRKSHQLAIVCSIGNETRYSLEQIVINEGLGANSLVLTGFVPDKDLCILYNLCSLFVFPSSHEGFGLPALEAMRCGAPVIGANTSSLPEVIGWNNALFNPYSVEEMAELIGRGLSDKAFRRNLIQNAQKQSMKFSWDKTARLAIKAMEALHTSRLQNTSNIQSKQDRPRLAFVSPLPPEQSGIADYSAELLPHLSIEYEIDVIAKQETVEDPWIKENCRIRSVEWFAQHGSQYDRVIYHFGNSSFHQHMFGLIKIVPGVVVLHDFYLSGILAHIDSGGSSPGKWALELYLSHGYRALYDRFHMIDSAEVVWNYPCSLSIIQDSLGLIVHSPNSIRLASEWYGTGTSDWVVIPLMRNSEHATSRAQARKVLGLADEDFLVCSFGLLGPTKLNHRLLDAWEKSYLARLRSCHLIFVGANNSQDYGNRLQSRIEDSKAESNIQITGWVDKESFHLYLAAADLAVQLRSLSRGETSAAVLDCMGYGLPTIINANGSMADLDQEATWKMPDVFSDQELIEALETFKEDKELRLRVGESAKSIICSQHDPKKCADLYTNAIENFYGSSLPSIPTLLREISRIQGHLPQDSELIQLADAMATNFPPRNRKRQLLIDISELVERDAGTGIQRVVRNILRELLINPPKGYRVEPVYASVDQPYRYARRFTTKFLDIPEDLLRDEPIDYAAGDAFLGLDLQPHVVAAKREFLKSLRNQGVLIKFVVYDLLCILMPQYFLAGAADQFAFWLEVVSESDGAVCISHSVAIELETYMNKKYSTRQRPFIISWFHLGADINEAHENQLLQSDSSFIISKLRLHPCFLMVGTLEPRKGHSQVLDAFDQLWHSNSKLCLVIVGRKGWMVEELANRIKTHSELGNRLFWLDSISDLFLESIYEVSTCLIAASYCEGFGLPLIEAAQHNLPIIARDIPVFREVAGENAYYFEGYDPSALSLAIQQWMELFKQGMHPQSNNMSWQTWQVSAAQLLRVTLGDDSHRA